MSSSDFSPRSGTNCPPSSCGTSELPLRGGRSHGARPGRIRCSAYVHIHVSTSTATPRKPGGAQHSFAAASVARQAGHARIACPTNSKSTCTRYQDSLPGRIRSWEREAHDRHIPGAHAAYNKCMCVAAQAFAHSVAIAIAAAVRRAMPSAAGVEHDIDMPCSPFTYVSRSICSIFACEDAAGPVAPAAT
ncbi:hypothetical protein BD311DRAFT_434145 [Dichomitus squalens]|uniref:Uncharacterized protein n=1 Tax=Dichomitus squalens TaxID=114155 RepID=A0A4Q9MZY7_9APHY|nr:hypothetical protein BD311DRAFT_434145 [Dichomitus squalens]